MLIIYTILLIQGTFQISNNERYIIIITNKRINTYFNMKIESKPYD